MMALPNSSCTRSKKDSHDFLKLVMQNSFKKNSFEAFPLANDDVDDKVFNSTHGNSIAL